MGERLQDGGPKRDRQTPGDQEKGFRAMEVTLPIKTYSKLNAREHWAKRHRRSKRERSEARMLSPKASLPCVVTLTRIAPRSLDGDNLQGALKAIRDGVADRLGVDDADPRVAWNYSQERGKPKEYAVRIVVTESEEGGA